MTEQKLSQAEISLSSGKLLLGSYRIESCVGHGAQATLYKAEDVHLSRAVALKVFLVPQDEAAAERFKREAQILGSLNHPNIVKTFASGVLEDGRFCMVLEYVPGKSLADYLSQVKQLTMTEFIAVFTVTLGALDYLHEHSVLHRDIKPENILCEMDGDSLAGFKLSDFGIAKVLQDTGGSVSLTQTKSVGTAAYMSPEQCKAQSIDVRSDLYAVACVMYQTLYGKLPFEGSSDFDTMYKHMNEALPSLKELPEPLASLISKGLQKDPAARFQSAKEMLAALPSLDDIELGDSKKIHVERKALRKEKKISPLLVFLLLVLSTGLLGLYFKKTHPTPKVSSQVDPLLKSLNQRSSPEKISDRLGRLKGQELIDYAKSIILEYPQPKYLKARCEAHARLANAYYAQGLYDQSISHCQLAVKETLTQKDLQGSNLLIGDAYKHLAAKQRSCGVPEWRANLKEAEKYYQSVGSPSLKDEALAGVCYQYGHGARSAGDYAQAAVFFKQGQRFLRKARKDPTDDGYVDMAAELVSIYLLQKNADSALEQIPKISAAAEYSDYLSDHLISWLIEWSDDLAKLGKSDDALRLLQQSQAMLEKRNSTPEDRMRPALVEVCKGDVYRLKNDLKSAKEHYDKALTMYQSAKSSCVSNDVIRLGAGFSSMGQNALALESWNLASKIIEIADTRLNAGELPQLRLAYFYSAQKDFNTAFEYCGKAKHFLLQYRPDDVGMMSHVKTLQIQLGRKLKSHSTNSSKTDVGK